ncbi:MAG: hypothetical protein A3C92_00305 [Candidatus Sungbacteria bacterium RIFCSPHIGHO2_02_FULL_53_17]|nr:MAG: hypothetical protein A3C92_00305 [Candidatus Sungbacteria bacterium RIFCSPHIGHO2_02_FULL_53_17]
MVIASGLAGFFLERLCAAVFGPRVPVLPFLLLAVAWWLPMFSLSWRLWLGGLAGLVMDIFGGQTFGVSILVMVVAALLAEAFRSIISARDGGLGHVSVSAALAVSALLLMPIVEAMIGYAQRFFS